MAKENIAQENLDVCVGVITAVSGVKGYVKIKMFTEHPYDITSFKHIFDEKGRSYKIKGLYEKSGCIIAEIDGINSRNEAEKFANTKLFIKRAELPKLNSDEFYHTDLIGLDVKLQDSTKIGAVKGVMNFGGGDILEIYDITSEKITYLPFVKQYVPEVNLEANFLVVAPPEEIVD